MGTSIEVYDSGTYAPVLGTVGPATYPQINASQPTPRSIGDVWDVPTDSMQTYDTGWITPTLLNGWVMYDPFWGQPRYRKTASGMVVMESLIKSGTINAVAFTLPVGYRPALRIILPTQTDPNVMGRLDITAEGYVLPVTGSNAWFSINVLFFASA